MSIEKCTTKPRGTVYDVRLPTTEGRVDTRAARPNPIALAAALTNAETKNLT